MAWVVTDQGTGTSSSTTVATIILTIGAGKAITAGSLVVAGATDKSTTGTPGVADSASNTYTNILLKNPNAAAANGQVGLWYSVLASGLTSGATITFTKGSTAKMAVFAALSATGNSATPLDGAVTAFATGVSASPTVTSGTPAVSGELFIGWLGASPASAPNTLTQDSSDVWVTPLSSAANAANLGAEGIGGNHVTAGTSVVIYSPSIGGAASANCNWADLIAGFQLASVALKTPLRMLMGAGV